MRIIITGATGFIGSVLFNMLVEKGYNPTALVRSEALAKKYLKGGSYHIGDINDRKSLEDLKLDSDTLIIHVAGLISIATAIDKKMMYDVNYLGTKNITDLALKYNSKLIYVSSVEAIPHNKGIKTEQSFFLNKKVKGDYGKTKRLASNYVYEAMQKGLDATIIFPSGVVGPYDFRKGLLTQMVIDYYNHKIPASIEGGFDFVDCRDLCIAIEAIIKQNKFNELYLLTGKYYKVKEVLTYIANAFNRKPPKVNMPLFFLYLCLPFIALGAAIMKKRALFTLYSLNTLNYAAFYDNAKAKKDLGFNPRSLEQSINDTVKFLTENNLLNS